MGPVALVPILSPHGRLSLVETPDQQPLEPGLARRLQDAFARGSGHGLLQLGAAEAGANLPPVFSYWRDVGVAYMAALCTQAGAEDALKKVNIPPPPAEEFERLATAAPPMTGAEYLTVEVLGALWLELNAAFNTELEESKVGIQEFLKRLNPAWNLVGRVHFNLAENRKDPEAPFAFLATYTTRLAANAKAQHLPLGKALGEYAGAANKDRLLSLLLPVQRASENCPWLKALVAEGEIFHPLRWTPAEAIQLLKDVPQLESAGVVVRMPAAWRGNRPSRPTVSAKIGRQGAGGNRPGGAARFPDGGDARRRSPDRRPRSSELLAEIRRPGAGARALGGSGPRTARQDAGTFPSRLQRTAAENGLDFREADALAGGGRWRRRRYSPDDRAEWSQVTAGPWLARNVEGASQPGRFGCRSTRATR